jgi:hypothetical protein
MSLRALHAVAGLAVLLSVTSAARASTTFPEALRKKLELDAIVGPGPGCQLCHKDDVGGLNTATKPVGRALKIAGATGANVPSLLAALETLEAEGADSDEDGTPDIAELRDGTDPNVGVGGSSFEDIPLPQTGCGVPRGGAPSGYGWVLLLSAALWTRVRAASRRAR